MGILESPVGAGCYLVQTRVSSFYKPTVTEFPILFFLFEVSCRTFLTSFLKLSFREVSVRTVAETWLLLVSLRAALKNLVIYLAVQGLSCGTQDLGYSLQHAGSSSLTRDGTQVPCIGSAEPTHWTTGKSQRQRFFSETSARWFPLASRESSLECSEILIAKTAGQTVISNNSWNRDHLKFYFRWE